MSDSKVGAPAQREQSDIVDHLSQPKPSIAVRIGTGAAVAVLTTLAAVIEYNCGAELLSCLSQTGSENACSTSEYVGWSLIMATVAATTAATWYGARRFYNAMAKPMPEMYSLSSPEELAQPRP